MKNFSVYHDYEELYLFLRCINNKPGKFSYISKVHTVIFCKPMIYIPTCFY